MIEQLAIQEEETAAGQVIAGRYAVVLSNVVATPKFLAACRSVRVYCNTSVGAEKRQSIIDGLNEKCVPTAVYNPRPLHQKTGYSKFPVAGNGLPVSERVCNKAISLPIHPYLEEFTQDYICEAVRDTISTLSRAECRG